MDALFVIQKYNEAIYCFEEKYLKEIENKTKDNKPHKGYLIYLKDLEDLKKKTNYNNYKLIYGKIKENIQLDKKNKKDGIEQIEFKTSSFIINMIYNNNKLILISKELWKIICKKGKEDEEPILYYIKSNKISFETEDKIKICFKQKDNIIDISSFISENSSNIDEFKNILNDIKKYYNFEEKFIKDLLKEEKDSQKMDYLVCKNWLEKWKRYSYYEEIKKNFLKNNNSLNDEMIINELIYLKETNKNDDDNSELKNVEILYFSKKNEMESFINKNPVALVPSIFSISNNKNKNYTKYCLYGNKIRFDNGLKYKSTDNIIISKSDNNNNTSFDQLLKIYFFRKKLYEQIDSKHKTLEENENNNIYLINKNIINNYKKVFDYSKLTELLKNKNLKGINYDNLDLESNKEKIYKILSEYKKVIDNKFITPLQLSNINTKEFSLTEKKLEKKSSTHVLNYYIDFEIINQEIKDYFVNNLIINENKFFSGYYIAGDKKIFIILKIDNKFVYEIGHFDHNDNFILEYSIRAINTEHKEPIFNLFKEKGIDKVIKNHFKDKGEIKNPGTIGYYYYNKENNKNIKDILNQQDDKLNKESDNQNITIYTNKKNNNKKDDDNKFTTEVLKFLLSIFLFEKDLQTKNFEINDCYLINKKFILEIMKLFPDKFINKCLTKCNIETYSYSEIESLDLSDAISKENKNINLLNKNKKNDDIFKQETNEFLKIENKNIKCKNNSYFCPIDFSILNKDIYLKLLSILKKNQKDLEKKELKFGLKFNQGKILIMPETNSFFDENKNINIIYQYSLNQNENETILDYIPESIISFNKIDKRNKSFHKIKINENYFKSNDPDYIIINITQQQESINNDNTTDEKENIINLYIKYSLNLYNEYSIIRTKINDKNLKNYFDEDKTVYYLINRNFMENVEEVLLFQEIKKIIEEHKELEQSVKNINKDNEQIIEKLKDFLKEKIKDLNEFNKKNITEKINYYIYKEYMINNKDKVSYYYNYQIINKEIFNIINNINNNVVKEDDLEKCYLRDNKIFVLCNIYTGNIGSSNNNNIFVVEKIFYSENKKYIQEIYKYILDKGYKDLSKFIKDDLIELKIRKSNSINKYNAQIFNILNKENKEIPYTMSEKLKTLILLKINDLIINNKNNNSFKYEKKFLINKSFLKDYEKEIKEIKALTNENDGKIKNEILKLNINSLKNPQNINNILSKFDDKSLKKIDENIKKINKSFSFDIKYDELKLRDKKIKMCQDFILLNENMYNNFENTFGNSISKQNIYYLNKDNYDIITIEKAPEYTMFLGKIDNDQNNFKVNYILDCDSEDSLRKIKNEITIKNYIDDKMIFDENITNNIISPIFSNNKLIGTCYKYKPNINYTDKKYINFYDYLSYEKIKNSINLYFNYEQIDVKMNKKNQNPTKEKYYLVNEEIMIKMKADNDFKRIYELMQANNIKENDNNYKRNILLAIKDFQNELENYKSKVRNDYSYNEFIPNITSVNINNKESFMIYNNFELFEKNKLSKIVNNIDQLEEFCLECILNDNKIIIDYPYKLNNKYILVIGILSYEKTFIIEYILNYKDLNSKNSHLNIIKGKINDFLKNVQFYNNTAPITSNGYLEIGTIFDYTKSNNDNIIKNIPKNTLNSKTTVNKIKKNFSINESTEEEEDEKYNLNYVTDRPYIRNHFRFCPKIGLDNIGATCYMNATLQCFCHIEKFINYFKYDKKVIEITRKDKKNNLTSSFKLLLENLWKNNNNFNNASNKSYAPHEFKNKISKMNPLFKGVAANDAKDLVNFIIMTLHEELNSFKSNNNTPYNPNMIMQQTNQLFMYNTFIQNFNQVNKSIISDLFYGINCNITQCGGCNTQTFNYQTYFFIVFPLEEVRKFKQNNFNNNFQMNQYNNFYNNQFNFNNFNNFNNINKEVTIFDCFDYDCKINVMSGANAMYCNYCKQTCASSMRTVLTTGPEILILLLNRGKGIEFNVKINFPAQLNISNYLQINNQGFLYQLIGVITHIGESGMGGHFIAYCLDPLTGSWDKYNDSIVTNVTNFQNEVINFANPYLLFYQKIR